MLLAGTTPAHAEPASSPSSAPTSPRWSIAPGTPLADALRTFARVSGYDVVFADELVRGKTSTKIDAGATPVEALGQILRGSGLSPRFTRPDAFIIEAAAERAATADLLLEPIEVVIAPPDLREAEYRWYGEKLLQESLAALRRSSELGMQSYSFTLYVWLSSDGQIVDLEGRGSEADNGALAKARGILMGMVVGSDPPANMPQPVGLRIISQ